MATSPTNCGKSCVTMRNSLRREVLGRDRYCCQECNTEIGEHDNPHVADAEVHHIKPKSEGGADEIDNLIALCSSCHNEKHSNSDGSDYRAIVTDREKEILRGDADVTEKYYYRVESDADSRHRDTDQ